MPRRTAIETPRRPRGQTPLTRARIVEAAIGLADLVGFESLSMRKLAQHLGVDPMSLYNHVRDKDDLLDAMADGVIGEIEPVPGHVEWKAALRDTVLSARRTLLRHPWAPRVIETRVNASPATLGYLEGVMRILREGGFSIELAHHTLHVMGSRVLGFSQDLFVDSSGSGPPPEAAAAMSRQLATTHPYLGEMAMAVSHDGGLGPCDDDTEFEFALGLILDGLERLRHAS